MRHECVKTIPRIWPDHGVTTRFGPVFPIAESEGQLTDPERNPPSDPHDDPRSSPSLHYSC